MAYLYQRSRELLVPNTSFRTSSQGIHFIKNALKRIFSSHLTKVIYYISYNNFELFLRKWQPSYFHPIDSIIDSLT